MSQNITMQDIADIFGVSKVTVSKALNDKDGVSEELKEKIQSKAQELGYRFNSIARSLNDNATYNIGVIVAERYIGENANAFYMSFYQQIAKQLDEKNYSAILHQLNEEDENNLVLPRIYKDNKVDGLILLGQVSDDYVLMMGKLNVPVMFLDFYDELADVDAVISDNFYGAYEITNYLFRVGHKKIAYVGNLFATSSIQDRFLGFYKSLLEHKVTLADDYIISDRDEHGDFIDLKLPDDKPTAIVCNCDQVAHKLIMQLNKDGIRVPEDISVVGFDNDIYATISIPPITTIEVNIKEMTEAVIKRMLSKVQDPTMEFGRIAVKGTIVHRESVKKIN